jgi:8-oxo-dGTP pyrophosphatase MutT (NUDIX family)
LRANPHLFNGRIFSADHLDTRRIDGHFTDYSRLVAQINRPDLAASLALRPLAVCGVTVFWQDGQRAVLFGQRSDRTSYQQGLWQLPPAGSIDPKAIDPDGSVDVRRALLTELHEEVGVPPDAVRVITPLCIVEHPETNVTDLGFALHTDWSAEAVLAAQARTGDTEYSSVQVHDRAPPGNVRPLPLAKEQTSRPLDAPFRRALQRQRPSHRRYPRATAP